MPRSLRLQFEGAFYHVFDRGNRQEPIFLDADDYREFEDYLLDSAARANVSLYSWCPLPNHFHLLVQTPDGNLAFFMQLLPIPGILSSLMVRIGWRLGISPLPFSLSVRLKIRCGTSGLSMPA